VLRVVKSIVQSGILLINMVVDAWLAKLGELVVNTELLKVKKRCWRLNSRPNL